MTLRARSQTIHARLAKAEKTQNPSAREIEREEMILLYRERAPKLTATLRKMFGDGPPDPEDVTQQAFQKIMERKDAPRIENLNAYLWRTARNICLKGRRHEDVRGKYDFEIEHLFFPQRGDDSSPEGILSSKEEITAINEALRQMPERRRRAFILNKVEGLTLTETAERLKIGRSSATRHVLKAFRDIELYMRTQKQGAME